MFLISRNNSALGRIVSLVDLESIQQVSYMELDISSLSLARERVYVTLYLDTIYQCLAFADIRVTCLRRKCEILITIYEFDPLLRDYRLYDQQVLFLVRTVRQSLIEYANIVAEVTHRLHDRPDDRVRHRRQEISHRRACDFPHAQTRRDAPNMLKCEAGECKTQTESEQRRHENGEQHVTTSSGETETMSTQSPGALGTTNPFRFPDHIVPHHLKMLIQAVGVPVLELDDALALRGGLRLLHPWNTDSRTFGHSTAEAVSESRQHSSRDSTIYSASFSLAPKEKDFRSRDARLLFLSRVAAPSRK